MLLEVSLLMLARAANRRLDRPCGDSVALHKATSFAAKLVRRAVPSEAALQRICEKLDACSDILDKVVAARRAHPGVCPSEKLDRLVRRLERCQKLLESLSYNLWHDHTRESGEPSVTEPHGDQENGDEGGNLWLMVTELYATLLAEHTAARELGHLDTKSTESSD
ncbi:hypothetical protein PsYK624_086950 [Phanerochaete sordida]|uniref:Uncharacterized protein n=1 Tax=Phanerochaete sordida TaxID=48140 RepID=A0A9P3GD57_9APHY|nr:hypothetical protein PsYK624_086950 [Phanerochaete sordida]